LGERLLCKQEVVGSIPSGSTNLPTLSATKHTGASIRTCHKSQVSTRDRNATRVFNLLHREEGIDLGRPPAARAIVLVEDRRLPWSAVFKPPAVGSISMKIWS
jgi:hypothetical protein